MATNKLTKNQKDGLRYVWELSADSLHMARKEALKDVCSALEEALDRLEEIRCDAETWMESVPENLQETLVYENVEVFYGDVETQLDAIDGILEELTFYTERAGKAMV